MPAAPSRSIRPPTVGFLELAIGLLVLGAGTSVAIPWWMSARVERNERAAIVTLHQIHAAQLAFRERSGGKSYAALPELFGHPEDGHAAVATPALMELEDGRLEDRILTRDGHHFAVFLAEGGSSPTQYATEDHGTFVAYAWPVSKGYSGHRVFAVSTDGVVWQNDNAEARYEGRADPPDPAAAQKVTKTPFARPPSGLLQLSWEPAEHP